MIPKLFIIFAVCQSFGEKKKKRVPSFFAVVSCLYVFVFCFVFDPKMLYKRNVGLSGQCLRCPPTSLAFLRASHVATRNATNDTLPSGIAALKSERTPKTRTSVLILTQLRTTGFETPSPPKDSRRRGTSAATAKAAKCNAERFYCEPRRQTRSDNVELAHGGLLLSALLVQPLPPGGRGQDGAVLRGASVGLRGRAAGRVPVLVRDGQAALVDPGALRGHVVDAQPHVLVRPDALADVLREPLVVVAGRGRAEDAAQVVAVLAGRVVALPGGVGQVALAVDLCAFQTD